MARVLLVEDRDALRRALAASLSAEHDVDAVGHGGEAIERLDRHLYDVVVTDVRLPGADGHAVLAAARARSEPAEVIMMTGHADLPSAVGALKAGAWDYLAKPVETEVLARAVARAASHHALRVRAAELERLVDAGASHLVGESASTRALRLDVQRLGPLAVPVLVVGEPGTGRQAVARALHLASGRPRFRVVVHAPGLGWAEVVDEGETCFHEHIGLMSAEEQRRWASTLRAEPGGRVVAGCDPSWLPLEPALTAALGVAVLRLAPLRERRQDVGPLAARFLARAGARWGTSARRLSVDALGALERWDWPGNVTELRQVIEAAAVTAEGPSVELAHLPDPIRGRAPPSGPGTWRAAMEAATEQAGREYLTALMRRVQGNVTRAAEEAGLERESLHRLLRRHGLEAARFRG